MIEATLDAATDYSAPIYVPRGRQLAISLIGTGWTGTIQIQRLVKAEGDSSYPAHDDAAWATVSFYTADVQEQVQTGEGCWYRAYCSAQAAGSMAVRLHI
jgi:hypothetical protein